MSDLKQLRITVIEDERIALLKGNVGFDMVWGMADAIYFGIKQLVEFSEAYAKHKDHSQVKTDTEVFRSRSNELRIHRTGLQFVFELNGMILFDCPYAAALAIGKALYQKAREVEELEKANKIIADDAILIRTGIPVGLSHNPKIRKESWKDAEYVRFPGMIVPTVHFAPPNIIQTPPKPASQPGA